ncbi:ATP-binding protein [Hydrogenophaga taeniospiralis]|uniref:ATP-binding protein n=1 Tax=Hydrogenophaga taeniospiralis TaxID=65656 RepID=UPI001CFA1926|nr:ATP-binding protein [Hydrogenophaga taeniospiralis]UCU92292.1 ATP-binding protein [Hydrogenophaga taeniospiralis]
MAEWKFYGRTEPLSELTRIVNAGRWYFCRIEGRRRIGKTSLLSQLAKVDEVLSERIVYMQVPDSDERDVATTFQRALTACDHSLAQSLSTAVVDFPSMARAIGDLCRAGLVVVIDEFQYFTRAVLKSFNSFLQAEVDKLRDSQIKQGGLFVLGSLHADMNQLLEDKGAPLYGRLTQRIRLDHWDFEDLLDVFRGQEVREPSQWLTLWTFFEGVPKFYHDAYEQDLYHVQPDKFADELLTRMFLRSSSPLSEEADTWFLRELRGRSLSMLTFLADHAGCSNGELLAGVGAPEEKTQISAYLVKLVANYEMVSKLNPVFSDGKSRNARYYIADNFLQAWLAVAKPAREAARMKPMEKTLELARPRLRGVEGFAFEKLIRKLHQECSRKGKGDFDLSSMNLGYWNRSRDASRNVEIDVVALDEPNKRIRFGSCKRSAEAHTNAALLEFEGHVAGFLASKDHKRLKEWSIEKVLFSPTFTAGDRAHFIGKGYTVKDLHDYASLF